MENYELICKEVVDFSRQIGKMVKRRRLYNAPEIKYKGQNDFVSEMDILVERKVVEKLTEIKPEAGVICEEKTSSKKGEKFDWVIDPIDGTANFFHGIYPCSISIALQKNGNTVLGVVYEIGNDECFYAWEGGPSMLNENEIKVSSATQIRHSLIAIGFPRGNFQQLDKYLNTISDLLKKSHGLRRMGSAATDLAYVACGRFDAYYEYNLKLWDVAAGAFIVKQAGGLVVDFSGNDIFPFNGEVLAVNEHLQKDILPVVKNWMNQS